MKQRWKLLTEYQLWKGGKKEDSEMQGIVI